MDALTPTVIADLIRDQIEAMIDAPAWRKREAAERRNRALLERVSENWAKVKKAVALTMIILRYYHREAVAALMRTIQPKGEVKMIDDDEDDVNDELINELMSVLSLISPEELTAIAALDGKTEAELDQVVANWKAERVQ